MNWREHGKTGWMLFKVMATIFYDDKRINTRVMQRFAEDGLKVYDSNKFKKFRRRRR